MPRDSRSASPRHRARHPNDSNRSEYRNSRSDKDGRDRRDGRDDPYRRRREHEDERSTRDNYLESRGGSRRDAYYEDRRGSGRDKDRRSESHRDDRHPRPGPSHRSTSPPPRSSEPRPHSRSKSPSEDKSKPNFKQSGLLAAATNTVKLTDGTSTVLKYNEPPEARKPVIGWRLYVFKGSEQVDLLHVHRQSAYLIGRDRAIADIAIDHPSCSKQHAVIQYRQVQRKDESGASKPVIKPFIIDLESTNGTHVNDETIPAARYYELKASDVIKFGQSAREYVILHDDA